MFFWYQNINICYKKKEKLNNSKVTADLELLFKNSRFELKKYNLVSKIYFIIALEFLTLFNYSDI
jgi:hypothetical protein